MSYEGTDIANDFSDTPSSVEVRQLQIVRAGSSHFAIFAEEISSIESWRQPVPMPRAPAAILGVVSIEGRMLTVVDLAMLSSSESATEPHKWIIALRGDEQLALAVQELADTAETPANFSIDKNSTELTPHAFDHDGSEVKILNERQVFPHAIQGKERRHRRF